MATKTTTALLAVIALAVGADRTCAESITKEEGGRPAIKLTYAKKPSNDPEFSRLWKDVLDQIPENLRNASAQPSEIYATSVKFPDGRTLTFSMLSDRTACNAQQCDVRVFEGGKVLFDGMVCAQTDAHFVSADADTLAACDKPYAIPPKR